MIELEGFGLDPEVSTDTHTEKGDKSRLDGIENGRIKECEMYFGKNHFFGGIQIGIIRMQQPHDQFDHAQSRHCTAVRSRGNIQSW